MKKILLHSFLLLTLLSGACSGMEDEAPLEIDGRHYFQAELKFNISVDPQASSTRASRPLESSDCWQRVSDVKIYLFRSDTGEEDSFYYYFPTVRNSVTNTTTRQPYLAVDEFSKDSDDNWDDHISGNETHTYTISPLLENGYYRFLAVGRDDNPQTSPLTIDWQEGVTRWDEALMQNTAGHPRVTEIFSGYPTEAGGREVSTLKISDRTPFNKTIVLHRAVAGVLLNVKNIPVRIQSDFSWYSVDPPTGVIRQDVEKNQFYNVNEVAIVCAGYYPTLDLVSRRWHEPKPFQPDASRFFATRLAWVSTKGLTSTTDEYGNTFYPQSLYHGNFVFPAKLVDRSFFADYTGGEKEDPENLTEFNRSLYLCFYTISRSGAYYPVKMIPIKIARTIIHDPEAEDNCAGDDVLDKTGTHFNLVANHIYCLGKRCVGDGTDIPIDLNDALNHPELEITVVGAWQVDVDIDMNY